MINLPGYKQLEKIQTDANTVIYRGQSEPEQQPVMIKILKNQHPTLEESTQLKHEYQILKNLDIAGIVKAYSFVNYQNSLAFG